MNQQAERRVGTIIGGKWRVDALLGSGSMAAVYGVTHRNGARAALKILHPTLCTDPAVCERFLGEGYLANSVKHAGIVRVLDDGLTDDGCVFLTMDLLEGDTLEALRQKRGNKLSIAEALDLGDRLMDVLSAVHGAGIIHRDLKPQNVFVCDDGVLKLLDFGVARVFDRTSQSKLSMFGLVLGTPSFMSPEQALGSRDKVDHRSDIWSLGATLFTALTGETVHLGANVQAKLLAAATVKARSIAVVMPSLPADIASAIDVALRFKKEDRWQSVDAMRAALREARGIETVARVREPVRAFDMSLDESTHVDKGGNSALSGVAFDSKTTRLVSSMSEPPPEGPGGTFIGIGDSEGKMGSFVGSDGSVRPPAFIAHGPGTYGSVPPPGLLRPSTRPLHVGAQIRGSNPPVSPLGEGDERDGRPSNTVPTVRKIAVSEPPGARRDVQEGSIAPYGNTLSFGADESASHFAHRDVDTPRKASLAVWVMAGLLTASVLGGIAFVVVKRPSPAPVSGRSPDRATAFPVLPAKSAVAPLQPPTVPQPTGVAAPATGDFKKDGVDVAESIAPPAARTGGSPWRPAITSAAGGHVPRNPRPAPTVAATATSPPPTAAATAIATTTPAPTTTQATGPSATQAATPPTNPNDSSTSTGEPRPTTDKPPPLPLDPFGTPE